MMNVAPSSCCLGCFKSPGGTQQTKTLLGLFFFLIENIKERVDFSYSRGRVVACAMT